jgi:serine/threonine protein kinase/formylglycine-generating enzyme required for sulfatase activity
MEPRSGGSQFDTVASLVLEYLDQKQKDEGIDPESFRSRLPSEEARSEFTRLLELYDHVDRQLSDASPLKNGMLLGDFRIIEQLGRGGMGVVYLAEQVSLKRRVALKILPQHLVINERARERFRREILSLARLRHKHLVPVHQAGTHEGVPYFVMEYIEGRTLHEVFEALRDRKPETLTARDVAAAIPGCAPNALGDDYVELMVRLVIGIADTLHYAHESGVLHRDVKPQNILVATDGSPLLFDFGLAHEEGALTLTRTGEFTGSPYYVAPEQIRKAPRSKTGGAIDRRADLYALGVTLYEALTLSVPFIGDSTEEILRAIMLGNAPPLRRRNPLVLPDLETIVHKAMERDPRDRYATAKDFADDLRSFLARRPIVAQPPTMATRTARWAERHPVLVSIGGTAVLAGMFWWGLDRYQWHQKLAQASSAREHGELEKASEIYKQMGAQRELLEVNHLLAERNLTEAGKLFSDWRVLTTEISHLRSTLRGQAAQPLEHYHEPAEREQNRKSAAECHKKELQAATLLNDVRKYIDDAKAEDASHAAIGPLELEVKWRESLYRGDRLQQKILEETIRSQPEGEGLRAELPREGTLTVSATPEDADVYLFRYFEQSELKKDGGDARLVPVPWARPSEHPWCLPDLPFYPGDACVAITSTADEGVLTEGDFVLAFAGRPLDRGVFVTSVMEGGLAAKHGLKPCDHLLSLGGRPIEDLYDVAEPTLIERKFRTVDTPQPEVILVWESLGDNGWEHFEKPVTIPDRWCEHWRFELGDGAALCARAVPPRGVDLQVLSDGEPRRVMWPAGQSLGVQAERTAYPLVAAGPSSLGGLPVHRLAIEPGSYLVVLRHRDFAELRQPVLITSGADAEIRLTMVARGSVPEGFVLIPGGVSHLGDVEASYSEPERDVDVPTFFLARREVTVGEYNAFLDAPEFQLDARRYRTQGSADRLMPRDNVGRVFEPEPDDYPVSGISLEDAEAYCDWRTRQHRLAGGRGTFRLPTGDEWEKAARGVDARLWPFGNVLDSSFAHLWGSRPENRRKVPVETVACDDSVYGARDLTGSVQEWIGERESDVLGRIRGASYATNVAGQTRGAAVSTFQADQTYPPIGFRLVWVPDESD